MAEIHSESRDPAPKQQQSVHPNPSQAEGDRETIDEAIGNRKEDDEGAKVSPEEATRIQSYDLPAAETDSEEKDKEDSDENAA